MRFGAPGSFFYLLVLIPAALVAVLAVVRQRTFLARLGDRIMVTQLARGVSLERRLVRALLTLAVLALTGLALAQPRWGRHVEEVRREGVNVMILMDMSLSMLATDAPPDRLTRARAVAMEVIEELRGHRVGVAAFAGSAWIQCPLTLDRGAVRLFLDILGTEDAADAGSDLADGLDVAREAFPEGDTGQGVIVVFSDGEDHPGRALEAASRAAEAGLVVYTLGIGTEAGGPIPLPGAQGRLRGYKKDGEGRVVTTRMQADVLQGVAAATGGRYLATSAGDETARAVGAAIAGMAGQELESRIITTYRERFQIPLGLALLLLGVDLLLAPGRRNRRPEAA